MKQLAKITAGQIMQSGIYPGLPGDAPTLWADCENVLFDNGMARKAPGFLELDTFAAVRPTGMKSTTAAGEYRLYMGADSVGYMYNDSAGLTAIANFVATGGVYQFLPWDTWTLITNDVDPVQLWQNAGMAAEITAPFARAKLLFKYQTQAFAANTDNGGQLIEWCSINDVTDWTPTLLNTAGNLRLRELEGDIFAAAPIGNSIGIYGEKNAGLFTATGNPSFPYGFRKPISGVKAISPYSIVSVGDRHYGICMDNAFVTDLISSQQIDEPAMRLYLEQYADWDRRSEVYGWPDWANNLIRWSIPKLGGGILSLGYRFDRSTWTRFNDGMTLGEESGGFANMLTAKAGSLYRQDKTSANLGAGALSSFLRTKPLDLGNRQMFKRISWISLDMVWSGNVYVKLGYSNHPNEAITWLTRQAASNVIYADQVDLRSEMVFLSIQIETEDTGATWKLYGAEIWGEITGGLA